MIDINHHRIQYTINFILMGPEISAGFRYCTKCASLAMTACLEFIQTTVRISIWLPFARAWVFVSCDAAHVGR